MTLDFGEQIVIHGHRGYRSLLPENCLQGFLYAASLGVDALELDVVVTRDHQLLVSHDPFMHHEISTTPDGRRIAAEKEKEYNIWHMYADEAQRFPMGKFRHPRFPDQMPHKSYKPLLRDVIFNLSQPRPWLNIELKSQPDWYGSFQPHVEEYADICITQWERMHLKDRFIVQSFDAELLRALHRRNPILPLVYLTEDATMTLQRASELLDFNPTGFSPHHSLIDEQVVESCEKAHCLLLTWTVNDLDEMQRLHHLGVKHIITDEVEKALAWKKSIMKS